MADLSITAANVNAGSSTVITGVAGATITAGQAVYQDPTTKKILLADSNGTAAAKNAIGVAVNGAALNQPINYVKGGSTVTIGATLTAGVPYWLSDAPGGIAPYSDVGSGENAVLIGVATSTSVMRLVMLNSGVTL